jgi:hypothetical protein
MCQIWLNWLKHIISMPSLDFWPLLPSLTYQVLIGHRMIFALFALKIDFKWSKRPFTCLIDFLDTKPLIGLIWPVSAPAPVPPSKARGWYLQVRINQICSPPALISVTHFWIFGNYDKNVIACWNSVLWRINPCLCILTIYVTLECC